jgi:hypothetical protein
MGLLKLRENARSLSRRSDVYKLALEVVKSFQGYLIELQQDQLNEGKDNKGGRLRSAITGRSTYSRATEEIAKQTRPRKPKIAGQPYNFEDTGDFIDSIFFEVNKTEGKFGARDEKTDKLLREFGENLLGLTKENIEQFLLEKFKPEFIRRWKQKLLT